MMRTLNVILNSDEAVQGVLDYVFWEHEVSYGKLGTFVSNCAKYGVLEAIFDARGCRDAEFSAWARRVRINAKAVAAAINATAPEHERFALKLAEAFHTQVIESFSGKTSGDFLRHTLWAVSDEFRRPILPEFLSSSYPGAEFYDVEELDYDPEEDSEQLVRAIAYYHKWMQRRDFYQKIWEIIS